MQDCLNLKLLGAPKRYSAVGWLLGQYLIRSISAGSILSVASIGSLSMQCGADSLWGSLLSPCIAILLHSLLCSDCTVKQEDYYTANHYSLYSLYRLWFTATSHTHCSHSELCELLLDGLTNQPALQVGKRNG